MKLGFSFLATFNVLRMKWGVFQRTNEVGSLQYEWVGSVITENRKGTVHRFHRPVIPSFILSFSFPSFQATIISNGSQALLSIQILLFSFHLMTPTITYIRILWSPCPLERAMAPSITLNEEVDHIDGRWEFNEPPTSLSWPNVLAWRHFWFPCSACTILSIFLFSPLFFSLLECFL